MAKTAIKEIMTVYIIRILAIGIVGIFSADEDIIFAAVLFTFWQLFDFFTLEYRAAVKKHSVLFISAKTSKIPLAILYTMWYNK